MKLLTREEYENLCRNADTSPRQRAHYLFHPELEDPIQRLVMVMNPGSYLCPHRHPEPHRWELFTLLSGRAVMLTFDDEGRVMERVELWPGGAESVVEVPGGQWHTLATFEPHTTLFECKPGPYIQMTDKNFVPWAPREGEPGWDAFLTWFKEAEPESLPPHKG